MKYSFIFFLLSFANIAFCQGVFLDENYDDWQNIDVIHEDPTGDGVFSNIDFRRVWASNDEKFLFLRIETGEEINLQDNQNITVYIDVDNNPSTGISIENIGAEILYNFGQRSGQIYNGNNSINVGHNDVGVFSSPTVSSDEFEIAIRRQYSNSISFDYFIDGEIKFIFKNGSNGDQVPNENALSYSLDNSLNTENIPFEFEKELSDFRLLSYNVRFDNLFENNSGASQLRLIKAVNPDIIAFQEIYDHSSQETSLLIENTFPNQTWFHSKVEPDIIMVSKHPIKEKEASDGNGFFLIEIDDQDVLIINAHLPCCDNDTDRQVEIDKILSKIRDLKNGVGPFELIENTPIILLGDLNLVGDYENQRTLIEGDIANNNGFGPDFNPDWDGSTFKDAKPVTTNLPMHITWYSPGSSFAPGRLDYQIYTASVLNVNNSFSLFTNALSIESLNELSLEINDSMNGSDHMPLVVDYSFNPNTATNSQVEKFINVFPNPTNNQLFIKSLGANYKAKRIIHTSTGKEYHLNQDFPIDVSYLMDGHYILVAEDHESLIRIPFVIGK